MPYTLKPPTHFVLNPNCIWPGAEDTLSGRVLDLYGQGPGFSSIIKSIHGCMCMDVWYEDHQI